MSKYPYNSRRDFDMLITSLWTSLNSTFPYIGVMLRTVTLNQSRFFFFFFFSFFFFSPWHIRGLVGSQPPPVNDLLQGVHQTKFWSLRPTLFLFGCPLKGTNDPVSTPVKPKSLALQNCIPGTLSHAVFFFFFFL